MRIFLDRLYRVSGVVAGCLILAICLLVSVQILLNGATRMFGPILPSTIPSYADFSGFMLAGASFLALAHTLREGGHIRVNLVTQQLPVKIQMVLEFIVLILAIGVIGYALWFMVQMVLESYHYNDTSPGIVPIPLAIPQSVVGLGLTILWISLIDTLFDLIRTKQPVLSTPDEV